MNNMSIESRKYTPLIPICETFRTNNAAGYMEFHAPFWGCDIRKDKNGNEYPGFFIDIETYDEKISTTIYFSHPVVYVRWADESGRILEAASMSKNQPDIIGNLVYHVENSELLEQFIEGSDGIFENAGLSHYVLWTWDEAIDIISSGHKPIVFDV